MSYFHEIFGFRILNKNVINLKFERKSIYEYFYSVKNHAVLGKKFVYRFLTKVSFGGWTKIRVPI